MDDAYTDYGSFICRIKRQLKKDLEASYPEISFDEDSTISEDLGVINQKTRDRFIFILDKRDIVFNLIFLTHTSDNAFFFPKRCLRTEHMRI